MTCMPKPASRWATRTPIRPNPMMPATLPLTSTPVNCDRFHSPDLREATACGTCRATASSRAVACSAALTMLELGAFTTITPAVVAALTSTLSRPTPARATTRRRGACASASASICVALRTITASASGSAASSSARLAPSVCRTSKSGSSSAIAAGDSSSATRTIGADTARPLGLDVGGSKCSQACESVHEHRCPVPASCRAVTWRSRTPGVHERAWRPLRPRRQCAPPLGQAERRPRTRSSVAASGSQSLARSPGAPVTAPRRQPDRLAAGWMAIVPALITLGVTLYRIGVPSFTRDEGATLLAVHRSFPQMIRMLGKVDVVHTEYYALTWAVTRVAGSAELAARAPSAVAMAVAAGGVTLLGQRLVSGRAGLAAGLLMAAFPSVSFYAEDAREYAIVTALATVASYFLVRALQAAAPGDDGSPRYSWLAGYAAALALLGLGNILSLLIIAPHAVTVAVWHWRYRGPGQPFVLRWLVSVAVALIVVSPVALIASGQAHQVQWIKPPGLVAIIAMAGLVGPPQMFFIVVAVVVVALAAGLLIGGR